MIFIQATRLLATNLLLLLSHLSATLRQVFNPFAFSEGPTVDKKGDLYFTDQPTDKFWRYDKNGNLTLYMDGSGRANGMSIDQQGT